MSASIFQQAAAWAAAQRQTAAATSVRTVAPALFRVPFYIDPPALLARTLMRFLNVYRLIRTKCYYDSFANERGHASDFCVVMFLLAIVTSQPDSGNAFLSRLIKPPDPPALSHAHQPGQRPGRRGPIAGGDPRLARARRESRVVAASAAAYAAVVARGAARLMSPIADQPVASTDRVRNLLDADAVTKVRVDPAVLLKTG